MLLKNVQLFVELYFRTGIWPCVMYNVNGARKAYCMKVIKVRSCSYSLVEFKVLVYNEQVTQLTVSYFEIMTYLLVAVSQFKLE